MCSSRPEDDPSQYDQMPDEHGPLPTESKVISALAALEYAGLKPEARAALDRLWNERPKAEKNRIREEIELDLL